MIDRNLLGELDQDRQIEEPPDAQAVRARPSGVRERVGAKLSWIGPGLDTQPAWLTCVLGLLVSLLTWHVGMNPPSPGLDASWNAGLAMAVHDGLQFGEGAVFSYGPLGFLQSQFLLYGDLAVIGFLYSAALFIAFCTALVWALRRVLPSWTSAVVAFLIAAVLPLLEQSLLLAALVSLGMLERKRSEHLTNLFVIGAACYAAIELLVKLSTGPVILLIFLISMIGMRLRWWKFLLFGAVLGAALALAWFLTGQSASNVPTFVETAWQTVSGYSSAMLRQGNVPAWQVLLATLAAAVIAAALIIASALGRFRDRRAQLAAVLLMTVASFATFKEGVVRADAGHLSLFFSTACVLWIAIPWGRFRWRLLLAGAALIATIGLPVRPTGMPTNLHVLSNLRYAFDQARALVSESRRLELIRDGRTAMKETYRLDPQTREALRGHTVAIEPWEIGVAWAYKLRWDPLPVFQNYQAYTSKLDYLNARDVESAGGPERILRENPLLVLPEFSTQDLDGRYTGWDPPAQARAVLCHFVPLHTTIRWQVLERTTNRCTRPRLIGSAQAAPGIGVRVPKAIGDEVVFAKIYGVGVSGLEGVTTLLLHSAVRTAVINGSRSYRLIPGTATDGLLLRSGSHPAKRNDFLLIPQAATIAVNGANETLRYSFYAIHVSPAHRSPPTQSRRQR